MDKQEINNAISEHAFWKFNLKNGVHTGGLEPQIDGCKECALGKWLYDPTVITRQKSSDHYKKVKALHAEFHVIAAKVAKLASEGDVTEVEKLTGFGGEFEMISRRLVEAMIAWRDSI